MVGEGSRFGCALSSGDDEGEGERDIAESSEVEVVETGEASGAGSLASAGRPRDSMSSTKDGRVVMVANGEPEVASVAVVRADLIII